MKWVKSQIGNFSSNHAIMCNQWHIARFVTYINGERVERYLLSDCSSYPHLHIKWFDSANDAKEYVEKLL